MERKLQLKYCKKCVHQKFEMKQGIICSLTNKKADLNGVCENFQLDNSYASSVITDDRIRGNKKNSYKGLIFTLFVLIVSGYFIWNYYQKFKIDTIKTFLVETIENKANDKPNKIVVLHESDNRYVAYAEMESGLEMKINIVIDGNIINGFNVIWQSDGNYEKQKSLNTFNLFEFFK